MKLHFKAEDCEIGDLLAFSGEVKNNLIEIPVRRAEAKAGMFDRRERETAPEVRYFRLVFLSRLHMQDHPADGLSLTENLCTMNLEMSWNMSEPPSRQFKVLHLLQRVVC